MKTNMEEISAVKKKLFVEIEADVVNEKLDKVYRDLGKKSKIPGFRAGKAPRSILERHYGSQVNEDITRDLINETLPKAIEEAGSFPLGFPQFEKDSIEKGKPFTYSAVMEVRPHFELENYLGVDIEKETFTLNEDEVAQQIERIRESNGKLASLEEQRPIQEGDHVVLGYEGFENGAPIKGIKSPNFLLKVGSNDFHADFEKALIGLNKGDASEIKVLFEDTYHNSDLAGKEVDFHIRIEDIKEMQLPDLNDDFVENLGADFKTMEELEGRVKESLETGQKNRIQKELGQRLIDKIASGIEIELPQILINAEIDNAVENIKQNFTASGSSLEKAGISEEKMREDFLPVAEKRVKERLILDQVANQEDIEISDEDLEKGYHDLAEKMNQPFETIKKYYEARNLVDSFKDKLLEEKTLNYLVENAKITVVEKDKLTELNSKEEN